MKKAILALLLLSGTALPAFAAEPPLPIEGRIGKLEKEMKAVQRKVFPGGAQQYFEPEIKPQVTVPAASGTPSEAPTAELARRVDALEKALAQQTGQIEQIIFNQRKTDDAVARIRSEMDARFAAGAPAAATAGATLPYVVPPATKAPAGGAAAAAPAAAAPSGDPGKDAYLAGYALWEQKKYPEAVAALKAMAAKYPKHKYASYSRNLAGRSYLDNGQYNEAIRELFENTKDEAGERAPQSYAYMAVALMKRKPPRPARHPCRKGKGRCQMPMSMRLA